MKWIKQTSRAWRIPMVVLMSMLMQFNAFAQECNPDDLYDAIVSAYHQSFAKKSDGSWSAWGQLMASNGTGAVLSPQDVNVTNYPSMTGTPLLASTASGGSGATEQSVLLTTTGLFVWGAENVIVNTSLTSSAAFQALTIGGNTSGLPSGVLPTDVHQLFATSGALSILTNSGALYMLAINGSAHSAMLGDATATVDQTWHRVKTNSSTFLSNVIAVRGHNASSTKGAMMALCYNGVSYSAYTWGPSTYLGGGGATASYNYATAMTLPSGTPKMIGVTGGNSAARNNSYFVLMTNGSLYSLGANDVKQLGDFSTTERLSWVNVKQTASANFSDVKFISAQEHDAKYPSAAIITNAGDLYVWGENNGNMLGAADGTYNPFLPGGFTSGTDVAKFVEVGGHTTVYVKENSAKFCYVGHRTNGSMGDGTSTSTNETTFNCSATPNINICGSTGWDYGDAPVAYENGGGSNLAFHFYVSSPNSIYLGASGPISNDDTPKNVVLATDNNGSLGDGTEENSVASFPAIGTSATSYSFNITLKNSLGSNANLYVWVDWNNNRRFESTEIYTTTVASNAAIQTKTATFSGLTGLTEGRRYVRIRFTSQTLTDVAGTTNWDERALGFASDGEMEDFNLVIGTLTGANVPPTTSNVTHSGVILASDGAMDIDNPVGADSDGSVVAYRIISLPSKGTLYKLVGLSLFNVALNQALTAEEANNLNYDPSGLSEGVDSFQLAAIDDDGAEDATPATYTINISCSADTDGDGICDANEIPGCQDPTACNYNAAATDNNGSCTYPAQTYLNCAGNCINDTDNDGICNELEVPGCTDPTACNYNAAATDNNGSCTYPAQTYLNCAGNCINDTDNDGICNELEVPGCTDPTACNYNAAATDEDASCTYPAQTYLNCDGSCINDTDNDGVCNELEVPGCTDPTACNFNASATDEDASCTYPAQTYLNCAGNCINDTDNDGICNELEVPGCTDPTACNYNAAATDNNGSCTYPAQTYLNCDGSCINDTDNDGICNEVEIPGCTDPTACNYNAAATDEDASCTYPAQTYLNCDGSCINDADNDGVCNELEVPGCTDPTACNYNASATDEDASCTYPAQTYLNCAGNCINDTDNDGICNELEVPGCTDPTACNYNAAATDEDASCTYPAQSYLNCDGSCINDTDNDGVCNEIEVSGCMDPTACNYDAAATDDNASCTYASLEYYADNDGDGFGAGDASLYCTDPGAGYVTDNTDCDDTNASVNSAATEVCNLIDDDCDGEIDEFVTTTYYADLDGDGFGDLNNATESCSLPGGYSENSDDCDDNLLSYEDFDEDGYGTAVIVPCGANNSLDCDDFNPSIYVGGSEICGNGIDENCDGVDEVCIVNGCTDPSACNYNASANQEDGTCTYPTQSYLNCDGTCINDTDNDGVCNELEVPGCTDPSACNYDPAATDEDASCTYPAQSYLNCDGSCINDTDNDGVCNELEVPGCTDPSACNYNASANQEDGTCTYPAQSYLNCDGTCINDTDNDGVCNELEVPGCTDPSACNYDPAATDEDASCTYPAQSYLNCDGSCINDTDNDGVCNELEVPGCTDPTACNYNAAATDEDESCAFASLTFYVDADGDGFGFGDGTLYCTNPGEGFAENNSDCDDSNANISPNAEEICNLIDDDCDEEVDEFVTFTYYADVDGDGYGNASETVEACELPEGYTNNQEDCDDALLTFQDLDGDGMGSSIPDACGSVSNEDCDDNNAQVFAGAIEICGNDVDEDCDGQDLICPLEGCTDTLACNYNPLAELENGSCTYPASSSVGCNGMCIADTDGDGICDPDEILGCTHSDACNFNPAATDEDESCIYPEPLYNCDGTCINDTDEDGVCNELEVIGCQDESACNFNASATDPSECTYPSLPYYVDEDGDNVGVGEIVLLCEVPTSGYADHPGDCDDTNPTIYAGAIELCNGVDDDCDSEIDEGVLLTFYIDTDGDGFGDNNSSIEACTAPEGYVNNDSDCDDTQVTYTDLDGDGYGSEGWVACGSYFNNDCDDNNAGINPNQTEICGNGVDEDCSGDDAVCPLIVATDNNYLANEDETNIILDVLVNDNATATSILPSTLDLDVATPGIQSTVTTPAGTWTANASGQIVFTPNSNYNSILNGDAVLTYQVSDANGVISNVATVTVEITPVEDSPIIVEEVIDSITPFQTPVEICLDAQEVDGQDNFIINVFGPNNGTVSGLEGTDYCFTYTPDSTFSGLDSIAIMMCDSGEGSICDTVWITIEVGLGAPIAHNDEASINEDELIVLNVLDNDDAGDLVIDPASVDLDPTTPGIQQTYSNADGDWSVDGLGNLTFAPTLNFNGNAHLFYSVNDTTGATSNTALVTIHVLPLNDAPQVLDENQTVVEETNFETPVVICINVQDVDGDLVSMTVLTGAANGNLSQVNDGDLCFEYTPNNGFVGLDSIAFVICDNGVPTLCDTAYVYINVVPTAPVVIDDNGSVNEDESVTLAILENDVTNGAALDLNTIDLDPSTPGVQNITTTTEGTWSVDGSGILTFVPAANFNGVASINYTVSDVNGNLSNTGAVDIVVNAINDAPNGPATVVVSTPFETALVVCIDPVLVVDIDGDDVTITSVVTDPANGVASNVNDGDLCFTYTPNANFTGLDSMLVTICDNGSPSLCDSVWVYVNVEGTSPIATDDYVNSNTATVSIDVALNDIIPGNVDYTVSIVDSTSNGTVVMNGSLISYTPNFGFCGTDSLTYAICNAMGMCDTAMLIIDVTPTDADSDGISDYYETLEGDADEDGTPNYLDTDSDNDGVSDAEEAGTTSLCDANFKDCDNDGTPDYLDFFTCGVQLEIPEGFSPNGDNTNDTWVIPGVSEFPENTITVFNRWGAKVYAKSPYDNSWDGTCNENAIGGNLLPEGTYFYVFTTGPNGETKNGYVYIKR